MNKTRNTPPHAGPRAPVSPVLLDLIVAALTVVLFWPLTRFFFAQDDFVLIETVRQGLGSAVGSFFDGTPGQFRPLTKGLHVGAASAAFGMNAAAWHVDSIVLHAANVLLLAAVLRRMGIGGAVARTAAAFFAFGMMNMEAVAWASCAQQLVGGIFLLATLRAGMDAPDSRRARIAAAGAFVLALLSYEQTLAAPFVLALWMVAHRGARATASAARAHAPLFALLALYLAFTVGYRGIPASGPYEMEVGANVAANLRAYTGMTFAPWMIYPEWGVPTGFTASHAAWIALLAFLLARRRWREIVFGAGTFLLLLAPVLFTTGHVHSFHLYVPAVGAWYLAAVALTEVIALLPATVARARDALLGAAIAACFVLSTMALHRNTTEVNADGAPLLRSFVLRRAVLAERMWNGLRAKANPRNTSGRLVLVYRYPQYRANWLNVHAALGQGAGVRLALDRPGLRVVFAPPGDIPADVNPEMEVLYFTELGECRTLVEMGIK